MTTVLWSLAVFVAVLWPPFYNKIEPAWAGICARCQDALQPGDQAA